MELHLVTFFEENKSGSIWARPEAQKEKKTIQIEI